MRMKLIVAAVAIPASPHLQTAQRPHAASARLPLRVALATVATRSLDLRRRGRCCSPSPQWPTPAIGRSTGPLMARLGPREAKR